MAGEEPTGRISNAEINRRVDNLEQAVHALEESQNGLSRQVDRLELGQTHLKEIIDARFSTIDQSGHTVNARLDLLIEKIDKTNDGIQKQALDNARYINDPEASPAGKALNEQIRLLEDGRKANLERIEKLERRIFMALGAVSGLVFFVNLFGPFILNLIGLPN